MARFFWKSIYFIIATIWHKFLATSCLFIIIITSEFTLFILAWITSSSSDSSTHSRSPGNAYSFITARLPDAARRSRTTRHYQSTSGILRDVCSYRLRRDTTKWSRATDTDAVIKGVTHVEFCARCRDDKSYLRHAAPDKSFATRETCSREIWRGLETHHFFSSPFLRPHNLISATPAQRRATRTAFPFVVNHRELYELLHRNDATCSFFLYKMSLTQHATPYSQLYAELALSQFSLCYDIFSHK